MQCWLDTFHTNIPPFFYRCSTAHSSHGQCLPLAVSGLLPGHAPVDSGVMLLVWLKEVAALCIDRQWGQAEALWAQICSVDRRMAAMDPNMGFQRFHGSYGVPCLCPAFIL